MHFHSLIRIFVGIMEETELKFDFRNVPKGWQLCFLSECPKKEECLRHLAASHLPESRDWGPAIYPTMKIEENGCRFFTMGKPTNMAWGFNTLFSDVKSRHERQLRDSMKQYLGGHSNYYRYNNGERLLTAEQQEWIIRLFQRYGYTEGLTFDHFTLVYDFDH